MVRVQPEIKRIPRQVWRITRHQLRIIVLRFAEDDPAHVRPEAAVEGSVWIAVLIGILVVYPMRRHPEDGTPFECQRSAHCEKVFDELGNLVRPMRMKPVIAHADAESDGYPIQDRRNDQGLPTEHEQGADGAQMENDQRDARYPINAVTLTRSRSHLGSPQG